jgi:protoporphyrinogen/coproporphyrinogen III oxidase
LSTLRILREPFIKALLDGDEESVWEFCARRFGKGVADRLVHPMVLGIFAGDSAQLAVKAAFPLLPELEREYGSVIKGLLAGARAGKNSSGGPKPKRGLRTFMGGIQSLPRALVEVGGFSVRTDTCVKRVVRRDAGWDVVLEDAGVIEADAVILASEAFSAASAVEKSLPELASTLREIPYPPVAVVGLGYTGEDAARIPAGFGVLIPRSDRYRVLGVTWDSKVFPGRTPDGGVLVRAMLGGTYDSHLGDLDEKDIEGVAQREAGELMGLSGMAPFVHTKLWRSAIPQYDLGHVARVKRVEAQLAEVPGLWIAGNSLYGTSFGKAAARGIAVADEVVEWLGESEGSS